MRNLAKKNGAWQPGAADALAAWLFVAIGIGMLAYVWDWQKGQFDGSGLAVHVFSGNDESWQCEEGKAQGCRLGICNGTQVCQGGKFDACRMPRLSCVPGKEIGCQIDGCSFGKRTCNGCGTGYGECVPLENKSACSGNCS